MKKLLCVIALMLALVCALPSCVDDEPTVSVNDDGYVVVNGVTTEIIADKDDVVTVEDGYLVVNGTKTEYKIHTEPIISVVDGFITVNGVKTEYEVNSPDVITVEEGYLVVNGVKTEHEVKNKNHSFEDWKLYNESENDCEKKLYYRTCSDCATIEWKSGKYEDHEWNTVTTQPTCQVGGFDTKTCASCNKIEICNETPISNHNYNTEYLNDNSYHWFKCQNCETITEKAEHTLDADGICIVCDTLITATEGIVYSISSDGTYAIAVSYSGNAKRIKIAKEYDNLPVKEIYKKAFESSAITSVIIPNSVTTIGDSAFAHCVSLESVVIPNSLTSIGDLAFSSCKKLVTVVIPNSVTDIGEGAFQFCESLKSVVIPNSITSIGDSAFLRCYSLKSVVICDGVISVGNSAFSNCYALTSIIIPYSVTNIGVHAFINCSSLTEVYYSANEEMWAKIEIGTANYYLTNATIHYNYVPEE